MKELLEMMRVRKRKLMKDETDAAAILAGVKKKKISAEKKHAQLCKDYEQAQLACMEYESALQREVDNEKLKAEGGSEPGTAGAGVEVGEGTQGVAFESTTIIEEGHSSTSPAPAVQSRRSHGSSAASSSSRPSSMTNFFRSSTRGMFGGICRYFGSCFRE